MDCPYRVETLPGNVAVAVPDSLDLLTPYVLVEQRDWFEDEIKFIRKLIRPGMRVVDVGANYGVYALTMAHLVGTRGRVWAFEPTSSTAEYLSTSIALNNYGHLELIEFGLSDRSGTTEFYVDPHAELSSLRLKPGSSARRELIRVSTLDECQTEMGWADIDFVKLDAEGSEARILDGGQLFFRRHSPLVMFELKDGERINSELIDGFMRLGYGIYSLVPGLQLLARLSGKTGFDPYQLNLFASKPDLAERLEARGLLASDELTGTGCHSVRVDWPRLARLAFASAWLPEWQSLVDQRPGHELYAQALNAYLTAHDPATQSPNVRYGSLRFAYERMRMALGIFRSFPRLQTFARIAWELGHRASAVEVLSQLIKLTMFGQIDFREPFLPVGARFDTMKPGVDIARWCLTSVLEQHEKLRAFSSYFTGTACSSALKAVANSNIADPELQRRMELIQLHSTHKSRAAAEA